MPVNEGVAGPGLAPAQTAYEILVNENLGGIVVGPRRLALASLANQIAGQLTTNTLVFSSVAQANANLNYAFPQRADIYNTSNPSENGVYQKQGLAGTGSWTKISDLSTAATEARIATLESNYDLSELMARQDYKARAPRMLWLMDSLGQDGFSIDFTNLRYIQTSSFSDAAVAWQFLPGWEEDIWIDTTNTFSKVEGANQGRSSGQAGTNTSLNPDLNAQTWWVTNRHPFRGYDIIVINLGINDIWLENRLVANIITDLRTIVRKALTKGAKVILGCPRPVQTTVSGDSTTWAVGSAKRLKLIDLRTQIISLAAEFTDGEVIFWDTWIALGGGTDIASANMTRDGLHLSQYGAHTSAAWLVDNILRGMVPNIPVRPPLHFMNFHPNWKFTGTAAPSGTRFSGTLPSGWNGGFSAGTAVFASASVSGGAINISVAPSSGPSAVEQFSVFTTSAPVDVRLRGQYMRAYAVVDLTSWNGWRACWLTADVRNASNVSTAVGAGVPGSYTASELLPVRSYRKYLMTPPILCPNDATTMNFAINGLVDGTLAGSGVMSIKECFFGPVEDPRYYRGYA